jgi:hypothetical protein
MRTSRRLIPLHLLTDHRLDALAALVAAGNTSSASRRTARGCSSRSCATPTRSTRRAILRRDQRRRGSEGGRARQGACECAERQVRAGEDAGRVRRRGEGTRRCEIEQRAPEVTVGKGDAPAPKVINIMAALKQSVEAKRRARDASALANDPRRTPARVQRRDPGSDMGLPAEPGPRHGQIAL